jgi:hypothetical protein
MEICLFLYLRIKKMMINPLPNDRIPRPKKRLYAAVTAIKTPSPRINVEYEVDSSISQ